MMKNAIGKAWAVCPPQSTVEVNLLRSLMPIGDLSRDAGVDQAWCGVINEHEERVGADDLVGQAIRLVDREMLDVAGEQVLSCASDGGGVHVRITEISA